MIQGKIPEVTIKFTEKPEIPAQGKKVILKVMGENNIIVKAELNGKNARRQVAKIDEFEEWVGALSGKITRISGNGVIEL